MRTIIFSLLCVLLLQTYSVRAQQAAQLTSPVQDANIDITNNISFKWNAAQVPDATDISYKVQVFEIGNSPVTQVKGSPVSFMNSQTPVWEAIQRKGLAASWPVPEKAVGKKYLWRVITLVGGQPRSFAVEMANYFYINSLTIKTDDVNKVITAEKKEVTFDNNNPPGRPKFPPQQKDTLPVNKPPSQTVASYTLTLVEPFNVSTIVEADSKYPIKFIWQLTPELNKNRDVTYRLRVFECTGTQTAQQAISNNPPVINKLSKRQNLAIETLTADAAGKKYAWTVEGTIAGVNGQKNIVVNADAWTFRVAKSGKEPGPKEPGPVKNKYTGPKLKYPNNGAELKAGAINNLQLSWEPVSPTPQQHLTYRWFVYEMQGGRSVTDIVKNSSPVKQGTVKNTFFTTLNLPADATGKSYAWTVQAVNDEGGSYGDNDGFADPFVFSVQSGGKITGPQNPPSTQSIDCNIKITAVTTECLGQRDAAGNFLYNICITVDNYSIGGTIFELNSTANPNKTSLVNIYSSSNSLIKTISGNDPSLISFPNKLPYGITPLCFQTYLNPSLGSINVSIKPYYISTSGMDMCNNLVSSSPLIITLGPCPCDLCETLQWKESLPKAELGPDKNTAKLTQSFNISSLKIKQVKADIVSFDWTANEDCKKCLKETYGYFIDGVATGEHIPNKESTFPSLNGSPLLFSNELQWNHCGQVAPQPLSGTFITNIALPPQTSLNCCVDQFRICIRYTIVTDDCKTCTKVLCYNLTRTQGGEVVTGIKEGKK